MEFALGFTTGWFIMWIIGMKFFSLDSKEKEKLKDFETWKEWKNKKKQNGNNSSRMVGRTTKKW